MDRGTTMTMFRRMSPRRKLLLDMNVGGGSSGRKRVRLGANRLSLDSRQCAQLSDEEDLTLDPDEFHGWCGLQSSVSLCFEFCRQPAAKHFGFRWLERGSPVKRPLRLGCCCWDAGVLGAGPASRRASSQRSLLWCHTPAGLFHLARRHSIIIATNRCSTATTHAHAHTAMDRSPYP